MARNGSRLPNSHQRAENGDSETNLLQNFTNFIDRYQSILQVRTEPLTFSVESIIRSAVGEHVGLIAENRFCEYIYYQSLVNFLMVTG